MSEVDGKNPCYCLSEVCTKITLTKTWPREQKTIEDGKLGALAPIILAYQKANHLAYWKINMKVGHCEGVDFACLSDRFLCSIVIERSPSIVHRREITPHWYERLKFAYVVFIV